MFLYQTTKRKTRKDSYEEAKTFLKKIHFSLIAVIIVFSLCISSASAANVAPPTLGGIYDRGGTRISWWMSYENDGGWYEYQIINAVNNWKNPGWSNPLNFVAASSNSGTMMDIYTETASFWPSQYRYGIYAETRFYNINSVRMNPSTNYRFTRIYLNDTTMHDLSATNMKGTIAHEIGHTLGLNENNNNINSIMCRFVAGRTVQTVQQIDNSVIVNLYS